MGGFAAILGYDSMQTLLGPHVLGAPPTPRVAYVTGKSFFPSLQVREKRTKLDGFMVALDAKVQRYRGLAYWSSAPT